MNVVSKIDIAINKRIITIKTFDSYEYKQNLDGQSVNIFASGPSVSDISFKPLLLNAPSIFVNGSLSLLNKHAFSQVVGYVISDKRFIKHQLSLLKSTYAGQPLYITMSVLEAIARYHPKLIEQYHDSIRMIFAVDRPLAKPQLLKSKYSLQKLFTRVTKPKKTKLALTHFAKHPNFVIENQQTAQPIGVSLDITDGFVEAGTVAYVAAQLAFSRRAGSVHLYGIDLINSNQPRFYESKNDNAPSKLEKAVSTRIIPSFNLLGRVYQDHGVTVYNHSPVSKDLMTSIIHTENN
ncbi:hypothetical protein AAIR29_05155 [Psychrobacter sp. FBL11]|uniref:Lipopolysaccharide core biosynthesis protein RfaZ n=1 Tax=Psychrobacter saeujeotis TaxID=3143436 RepID=A0ABU9X7S8_9GAMM|nr:hypothetical protein [uncultured Psychrobacter sp.]